MPIFAA